MCRKMEETPISPPPLTNENLPMTRRLRLVVIVSGLLITEYLLQSLYYHHIRQEERKSGWGMGWFNEAAIVVPKSDEFIANLDLHTCQFPVYYDKSRFNFKLKDDAFIQPGNWREKNKKFVGDEDARIVYNNLKQVEVIRDRMYEHHPSLPPLTRNLTYVHIGKAGGSTIGCNLRFGRKFIRNHCDNISFDLIEDYDPETAKRPYIPESAISRSVNCYTHWRMQLKCMYLQGDHPFRDIRKTNWDEDSIFGSRYLSEGKPRTRERLAGAKPRRTPRDDQVKPKTKEGSSDAKPRRTPRDDQMKPRPKEGSPNAKPRKAPRDYQVAKSQKTYPKHRRNNDYLVNLRSPLDRIASWFVYEHAENHGIIYPDRNYHCGQLVLSSCYQHFEHLTTVGLSGPRPPANQPLRVGTNLSAAECSHWAWATVQGNMPADYHNGYNYDWYAHRLLYDARNADSDVFVLRVEHLEQDWTTVDRMLGGTGEFPVTMKSRQNDATIKPLRIAHHNTTDVGLQNLCRALCEEIQVYKLFLLRAINLQPEDLEESMEELRQQCPEEVDIQPRECPLV